MDYLKLTALDQGLCWAFYNTVYAPAFDSANRRETPAVWPSLMRPTALPQVHIIVASEDEQIVGGIVFEQYHRTRSWLLSYLAVRPAFQRLGIGRRLFHQMLDVVGPRFALLFAEVEPKTHRIMHHFGFRQIPFDYVQPSLTDHLTAAPLSLLVHGERNVMSQRLRAFLAEYYSSLNALDSPHLAAMDARLGDAQVQVWTQALVDQDYKSG
jgi:GNAT superfamily N-acetyltransferase